MQLGIGLNNQLNSSYLPLDNYPELEFVYSIVRLVSSYKGPCMRVRRDNTVVDIPYTNKNLINLESLIQFVGSSVGYLVGWYDQGRKAKHSFQNDPLLQPRIVINGQFNPDGVVISSNYLLVDSAWLADHISTLIIRENASSINSSNWFLSTNVPTSSENVNLGYADSNTLSATQFGTTITYDNPSSNFPTNTTRVWAATSNGNNKKLYLNGVVVSNN
ncbi:MULTISPECIES: hypothetical protein [Calothrix]|uniref:Uncharacterized protein n=2 Tax=Calothrix TaxID=1186 RepID=A0ABR8ADL2_9CYAN|nr:MULTISPECIES: hypothetical protein [Calothrix]MBD2196627.1 hypothetical protein [Calothrix parietina FACHB-288]MBD2228008.1 hypothetical protein [Calothrix anomala FACHB-343]